MAIEQLPLPLAPCEVFARDRFVAGPANAEVLGFLDSWPNWKISAAAIYGAHGSGKSHLIDIWQNKACAKCLSAAELAKGLLPERPAAVDNADVLALDEACAFGLFHLLERATPAMPVVLTGLEPPSTWRTALPDLRSRFSALVGFEIGAPDETMLTAVARKLFIDRQLAVPDAVIRNIVRTIERSAAAVRAFVAEIDRRALATSRPVTLALVRDLLAEREEEKS